MIEYILIEDNDFSFINIKGNIPYIKNVIYNKNKIILIPDNKESNNIEINIKEKDFLNKLLNSFEKNKNFYLLIESQPKEIFLLKINGLKIEDEEDKKLVR